MNNKIGFTLIEVLIALVILSIALVAVIKATSQNIRDTAYLQNKTIATWVGTQVMNEARAGVLKLPSSPDKLANETDMLGQTWPWQAILNPTPNKHISEIDVDVFEKSNHAKLVHLVSYVYNT